MGESLSPQALAQPLLLQLFVDTRPLSQNTVRRVEKILASVEASVPISLQVINVADQPQLVEYYRLVVTPALVKIGPGSRQVLSGIHLTEQLATQLPQWLIQQEAFFADRDSSNSNIPFTELGQPETPALQQADAFFQLQQQYADLSERTKFLEQVIALVAHDLRNPLTAAMLAIDTIQIRSQSFSAAAAKEMQGLCSLFDQARSQLREIERMVAEILEATRDSGETLQINPREVVFEPLLQQVLEQLHDRWHSKQQQLKTDVPGDLPTLYADPDRLRQVLVNLLDNAIKYTPVGGTITIAALHRTSQKVQISVSDTGPGIPRDQLSVIFKNLVRLSRDSNQEGYGIGLSVCQRIVQSHFGRIWADSELGQGSTFHFTMPVYRYTQPC
ncbi:histidine kinase [Synechococcus elongatus]|uniref:Adaptive-response sensory-kinase SasA n=1 Tax=Synechococcus elongatus PCC 11802 TaxID=2283154 RepID=A0AAT9JTM7_SYNEL|nr:histidine kinase [Synechococcus elongatus]QFZ93284.1 histidine kinase [Synechococcus elongatus PCC 11802]